MLWIVRRLRSPCRSKHRLVSVVLSLSAFLLMMIIFRQPAVSPDYDESQRDLWLQRVPMPDDLMNTDAEASPQSPILYEKPELRIDDSAPELGPFLSPYIIRAEEDFSKATYLVKKPVGKVDYKNISVWDPTPTNDLKTLAVIDFSKCEYNKCNVTSNHSNADAVIFIMDKLNKVDKLPDFKRKSNQYWIFRTMEAPSRFSYFMFLNKTGFKEQFNWTMTYRMDSDIPTPFGRLIETYVTTFKDYDKIFTSKTRSVALFTTYCEIRSKTLDYVKKLSERIDVDIFGPCGSKQCTASAAIDWDSTKHKKLESKDCFPMLSNIYKFYLTFETSICRDYVTEILFQAYGDMDVVPVVRGGADYKHYFPTGTYIDVSDFSSPGALADFLVDVGKNKEKYIQYLKNKHNYAGVPDFPDWQCKLCQRLHADNSTRTYPDIHQWWTQIPCRDPGTDVPAL